MFWFFYSNKPADLHSENKEEENASSRQMKEGKTTTE